MQKIDFSYDINRKRIIVIFKNNFLIKNKSLLEEVVKSSKLPKNSNVTPHRNGERKNVCNIEIPYTPDQSGVVNKGNGVISMAIPSNIINELTDVVNKFSTGCVQKILSTTEIIPLKGYSINNIAKDVQNAIANQRNICIIRDYQDYLDGKNIITGEIDIAMYEYMSDKYCDIAIECVHNKSLPRLRKLTEGDLKKPEWI